MLSLDEGIATDNGEKVRRICRRNVKETAMVRSRGCERGSGRDRRDGGELVKSREGKIVEWEWRG